MDKFDVVDRVVGTPFQTGTNIRKSTKEVTALCFRSTSEGHRDWALVSILKSKLYQWTHTTTFVFYTHGWMQRGRERK